MTKGGFDAIRSNRRSPAGSKRSPSAAVDVVDPVEHRVEPGHDDGAGVEVGGQDVLTVRRGLQRQVPATGAQVERPFGGDRDDRPGERLGRAASRPCTWSRRTPPSGRAASCATTNPSAGRSATVRRAPSPSSSTRPSSAQTAGSIGAMARRKSSSGTGTPARKTRIRVASGSPSRRAAQHPGPVERTEAEIDRVVGRQPLADVPQVEARAVQDVADPAHVVGPVNGQRVGSVLDRHGTPFMGSTGPRGTRFRGPVPSARGRHGLNVACRSVSHQRAAQPGDPAVFTGSRIRSRPDRGTPAGPGSARRYPGTPPGSFPRPGPAARPPARVRRRGAGVRGRA